MTTLKTKTLNHRTALNICRAYDFARDQGNKINVYAVINLTKKSAKDEKDIFADIKRRYMSWLRYKRRQGIKPSTTFTAIWINVFENPDNGHFHANWSLHIPPEYIEEFSQKLPLWVERSQGDRGFDVKIKRLDGAYKSHANYIIKGVDPAYAPYLHVQDIVSNQGTVLGRRATMSRSLNIEARRSVGWKKRRRPYIPNLKAA